MAVLGLSVHQPLLFPLPPTYTYSKTKCCWCVFLYKRPCSGVNERVSTVSFEEELDLYFFIIAKNVSFNSKDNVDIHFSSHHLKNHTLQVLARLQG